MLQEPVQPPLQEGGLYVITGGLGGVGTELALHLVQKHGAKLILLGRTPLPPRTDWNRVHGTIAKRIQNYARIERTGGEFQYHAIDLSDWTSIRAVIAQAEANWKQPLAGLFHLAGSASRSDTPEEHWESAEQRWAVNEPIENFEFIFASKVYGTWALLEALGDRRDVLCVMFSSLYALFGAASLCAYSAANSFLDCISLTHQRSHPRTYCLDWSMWNDLGMSEASPSYARQIALNMGYRPMSKEQGINSMLAVLSRNHPHVLIGVDRENPHMRRHVEGNVHPLSELVAYYVAGKESAEGNDKQRFAALEAGSLNCRFTPLASMPRTASGEIDRARLTNRERQPGGAVGRMTEARNPIEEQIANVWRDVLARPQVSMDQSFFELGGDSLAATRLINRLRESFQVHLSVGTLFDNPTVAALATLIAEKRLPQDDLKTTPSAALPLTSPSDLLNSLDQLSEEEVDALLAGMTDSEFPQ